MAVTLLKSKKGVGKHDNFVQRVSTNLRGNWFLAVRLNLALQRLEVSSGYRLSNPKEMGFFFMRRMLQHDLDWYEAHFESEDGLGPRPVRGEISPIYGRLKAWQVRRIANLLPDLRTILTFATLSNGFGPKLFWNLGT